MILSLIKKEGSDHNPNFFVEASIFKVVNIKASGKNIQKADAYLENLLLDAFVEISDRKLAEGCQDLGAGGILCATTEVIQRGRKITNRNLGCSIFLDEIPLKSDIDNYSILASETQERMLLVSNPENYREISTILKKWGLEYKIIGRVNHSGSYDVYTSSHES